MTIEQLLRLLAKEIVEMEAEDDCIGAVASHLNDLIKESIKAEGGGFQYARAFASELDQATEEQEEEKYLHIAFVNMTHALFTPEEEEAIYGGDEK